MRAPWGWVPAPFETADTKLLCLPPRSIGSHKGGLHQHGEVKDEGGEQSVISQEVLVPEEQSTATKNVVLKAGQISFHDVFLLHGSAANSSPRRRAAVTLRYMPASSHYDRELHAEKLLISGCELTFMSR